MAAATSLSIDLIWKNLTTFLDPNVSKKPDSKAVLEFFNEICGGSAEIKLFLLHELKEWFFEEVGKKFRNNIAPKFWSHFQEGANIEELISSVQNLYQLVECFNDSISNLQKLAGNENISRSLEENTHSIISVIVFSNPPEKFKSAVKDFYLKAFKAHQGLSNDDETLEGEKGESGCDVCEGCDNEKDKCHCKQFLDSFVSWNLLLHSLGVLKKVCSDAFVSVIHSEVKAKIENSCKGEFDQTFLASLIEWLNNVVFDWMKKILPPKGSTLDDFDVSIVESWTPRLEYFMYKTYAELRIEELFEIIVDYPDSLKALEDLKECLEKTDLRGYLITSLRTSFETRLLHPGAETTDILTQYVSAIRALRVLDSSGVILENVCEPVKAYLRTRDDTVRCIVTSLTDENSSELSEELLQGDTKTIEDVHLLDSDNEDDDGEWMPDPIDADPSKPSRSRKSSDIISMLVNIYGSRDLFVSEYRTLLADRILSSFNYDIAKELRYLELLKLRFGESHLQFCEVMLKDVADSRRINTNIHSKIENSENKPEVEIHGMILSNVFWPTFREEKLELPAQVKSSMENYTEQYKSLKGSRTLNWKPHLGLVELDLELEDRTLSFTVTPARAATIMYFQQKPRWSLEELSTTMHMSSTMLRRCLGFWLGQGVLKQESQDVYVVLEKNRGGQDLQDVVYDPEGESAMATSQDQREGELQIFWSYIVGMLTNLDSLPLDRIHSMLRMFAMSGPNASQCNLDDLKRFLEKKVRDGELQFASGKYKLPKPGR